MCCLWMDDRVELNSEGGGGSVSQNCRNIKQAVCAEEKRSPNDRQLLNASVRQKWEESKSCQSPQVEIGMGGGG